MVGWEAVHVGVSPVGCMYGSKLSTGRSKSAAEAGHVERLSAGAWRVAVKVVCAGCTSFRPPALLAADLQVQLPADEEKFGSDSTPPLKHTSAESTSARSRARRPFVPFEPAFVLPRRAKVASNAQLC